MTEVASKYECWMWLELDPVSGWGVIAALIPGMGVTPLHTKSEALANGTARIIAEGHGAASGHQIRLVHLVEVVES